MSDRSKADDMGVDRQRGSVLIVVLWILTIIGFLTGEYLSHNRTKAELALNNLERLNRQTAVESVVKLCLSSGWGGMTTGKSDKEWITLSPGGVDLFVRFDSEGSRININAFNESQIRSGIEKLYSKEGEPFLGDDRADLLTDALLDWMDEDDLVRLNGVEKEYYEDKDKKYLPADGRFKTMTEMLMVKGMTPALFWGTIPYHWHMPGSDIDDGYDGYDEEEEKPDPWDGLSLLEDFTIYPESAKRISILIPAGKKLFYSEVLILGQKGAKTEIMEHLSGMLQKIDDGEDS